MRRIIALATLLALFSLAAEAQTKSEPKILVAYFSVPETGGVDASSGASRLIADDKLYGATQYVAQIIAQATAGDLFAIKAAKPYDSRSHKTLVDYAKEEANSKAYPPLANKIVDFDRYDVVFVGYPNWWGDMPRVIYSFLNAYDFSGKMIVAFCTHGGSGSSRSVEMIAQLEKEAKVIAMPAIDRDEVSRSDDQIKSWLNKQGLSLR